MEKNLLYYGDNLDVLRKHVKDESVDLIYLDPPFNSKRNYSVIFSKDKATDEDKNRAQVDAFEDTWHWTMETSIQYDSFVATAPVHVAKALSAYRLLLGENDAMSYLTNMAPRLLELHRVMKPSASMYLHCDPTMSHYLKVLLDAIFRDDRTGFMNEIIWSYRTGGMSRRASLNLSAWRVVVPHLL
ncbi:DNA methyltransferase [Mycobacteroides abscessus]|uniref:DNA methyltransferase n=1 Tax=Mycobacteroides abscessus TaxID=36809 RepID=UPI000C261C4A|nr:DNA methyltransferase [Mycobacteroides abscessus]